MHARPAGELVKLAKSLSPIKLTLCSGGKCANAASMLSLLALGLKSGSVVIVRVEVVFVGNYLLLAGQLTHTSAMSA